jgi:hypothetical protein
MAKPAQLDMFGAAPRKPTEAEIAQQKLDQAMKRFETQHAVWLKLAREKMVEVIKDRGSCSSDDCWRLCPPPDDAHPSVMGALFKDPRFLRISAMRSNRESANRRWISVYELKEML